MVMMMPVVVPRVPAVMMMLDSFENICVRNRGH